MTVDPSTLIEQQKEYYCARAGEYDEWFLRQGRYYQGDEHRARWNAEAGQVYRALAACDPAGRVLELACGTGWWTEQLVPHTGSITAVDASAEVLELNRKRVGDPNVRYVQADIFEWRPDAEYDVVFFGFWLSHVPPERFGEFWALVRSALRPGGRAFFVDSRRTPLSTARDHVLPEEDDVVSVRKLNDGRQFHIVKVFYDPADLQSRLDAMGWRAAVSETAEFFLYGHATRGD